MKYKYDGPLSGVSLKGHDDVMLMPGMVVELPEGHLYTRRLIKRGWLKEVAQQVEQSPDAKSTKKNETKGEGN